jgi:hypothetical protein
VFRRRLKPCLEVDLIRPWWCFNLGSCGIPFELTNVAVDRLRLKNYYSLVRRSIGLQTLVPIYHTVLATEFLKYIGLKYRDSALIVHLINDPP